MARLDAKRDTHKVCPHLVQAGGFRIDRHMAALADQRDPGRQRRRVADRLVIGMAEGLRRDVDHRGRIVGCMRDHGHGRHRHLQAFRHAPRQGAEFHCVQKAHQRLRLRLFHLKRVKGEVQRRVAIQLHQPF